MEQRSEDPKAKITLRPVRVLRLRPKARRHCIAPAPSVQPGTPAVLPVARPPLSGVGCLKHGHDARTFQVADRMPSKCARMLRRLVSYKPVHKLQTPVEPGEKFVFDLRSGSRRSLRCNAVGSQRSRRRPLRKHFRHGFERILVE